MYREQRDIIERIFTREVCRLVLAMMRREEYWRRSKEKGIGTRCGTVPIERDREREGERDRE
jgi:hypothetical protein